MAAANVIVMLAVVGITASVIVKKYNLWFIATLHILWDFFTLLNGARGLCFKRLLCI